MFFKRKSKKFSLAYKHFNKNFPEWAKDVDRKLEELDQDMAWIKYCEKNYWKMSVYNSTLPASGKREKVNLKDVIEAILDAMGLQIIYVPERKALIKIVRDESDNHKGDNIQWHI